MLIFRSQILLATTNRAIRSYSANFGRDRNGSDRLESENMLE